jgi:hypothetical protein
MKQKQLLIYFMEVRILPFFSPISPAGVKGELLEQLSATRGTIVEPDNFKAGSDVTRNYLLIEIGGKENEVADFLKHHPFSPPVMILNYELRNSLPAAMEIRSYLQHDGIEARIIHSPLAELTQMINEWCEFGEILTKLPPC